MEPEGAVERMEIGAKLKGARISAKLTQEQAAQALGVSRQTISNWENEKTYPDIISVVKMSDLYQISLDHLLKEEHTWETTFIIWRKAPILCAAIKRKETSSSLPPIL